MTASKWVVLAFVLLSFLFVIAVICDYFYRESKLKELIDEKKKAHIQYDEDELKDEIEPKQVFAWIYGTVICLFILLTGAVITNYWADSYFKVANPDNNKALFGDSFGAVNALVSAFAFAGMIVAFILQRYELKLQRKELKSQRQEFEQQNKTLKLQRFENTFFHMMELQQQIVAALEAKRTEIVPLREETSTEDRGYKTREEFVSYSVTGRNLFSWSFKRRYHEVEREGKKSERLNGMKEVLAKYGLDEYVNQESATLFDHYFRHLYTILQFIDKEDKKEGTARIFTETELYEYAKIVRATLSRYELVWLYYNGLSKYGNEKLKPLIENYCMLKNLRKDLLSCCKENREKLKALGISDAAIQENEFSDTDFEFFLTTELGDKTKYHIKAFTKSFQGQTEARALVNRWNSFLAANAKQTAE